MATTVPAAAAAAGDDKPAETAPATTTTAAPDKTVETTTAADTATTTKTDDAAGDSGDDILALSREDLQAIRSNPALRSLYHGLNKAATEKFQAIAKDVAVLDEIRQDPQNAARKIAEFAGFEVVEKAKALEAEKKVVQDSITKEISELWGDDAANQVKTVVEKIAQSVVEAAVAPLKKQAESLTKGIVEASSEAELNSFKASKGGAVTKEVEERMVQLSYEITAGENSTPEKYLGRLFQLAQAELGEKNATATVVDRMRKAAEGKEPDKTPAGSKVTPKRDIDFKGMSIDEMLDKAWDIAQKDLQSQ